MAFLVFFFPGKKKQGKEGQGRDENPLLGHFLRYALSTAGNSMTGEALSGTTSEKRGVPSRVEVERILEMIWRRQVLEGVLKRNPESGDRPKKILRADFWAGGPTKHFQ